MENFFKYLTPENEDKKWGLFLKVAGREKFSGQTRYPNTSHPSDHYFTWDHGRILNEFQVNYITEGYGVYEDPSGRYPVKPGTLLITKPGVWHRYMPDKKTGWTENYIGFDGRIAKELLDNPLFFDNKPTIYIGTKEEFIDTLMKLYEYVQEGKPGYQQLSAGLIMNLLGYIVYTKKQNEPSGRMERIIQNVRCYIRENVENDIDFKDIAKQNNVGYSYFRKMFKEYCGVPPVQYHLDLKLVRAKEMLLTTDKIIKEICHELGFHSIYYFSRFFKSKIGVSPSELRNLSKKPSQAPIDEIKTAKLLLTNQQS